ncbi:MAG: alanyl-tRNA editing protein [Beijerinckiaceae bacterium]
MTTPLFRDDAYRQETPATVLAVNERGGIVLDQTVFYATSGGQPGDTGWLVLADGRRIAIATTVYDTDRTTIVHVPAEGEAPPPAGASVTARLNWPMRYNRMRVHTALHLLTVALPYPVTGGAIGDGEGRLDFDIPDAGLDRDEIAAKVNAAIATDAAVTFRWITDEELLANPI